MILRGHNDPMVHGDHEIPTGGMCGTRANLVTISGQYGDPATVSTIYDVQTQTLLCDIQFLLPASASLVVRCLAHGFMSLVRSQPWPTLFYPNPLVTADRIGVSVLGLCQHFSVR